MTKKTGLYLMILLNLVAVKYSFAQQAQITPTSPEASALAKLVNFPVNLNTGLPDIHLPLYQIDANGITLPVGLSYHSGGFKINEQATSVGLGWALDCDYQITRTVNGQNDFTPGTGYLANTSMRTYYENFDFCPNCEYPLGGSYAGDNAIATGGVDGAPDRYNYKLANKSGSFYFEKNSTGTGYQIVPVPFENIKIQYNNGQFIITDDDGTVYYFGTSGVYDLSTIASMGLEVSGQITTFNGACNNCSISAWKCKKIQNPTNTESINFTYQTKTVTQYSNANESIEYYNNPFPCNFSGSNWSVPQTTPGMTYEQLVLAHPFPSIPSPKYMEITASGNKFHIPYTPSGGTTFSEATYTGGISIGSSLAAPNVAGLAISTITFNGGSLAFSGTDKIDSIRVLNTAGQTVKTFALFHSYMTSPDMTSARIYNGSNWNGTLYLDSIQKKNNNLVYERYLLLYNRFCFGSHLKGHDAWGYPNVSTVDISMALLQADIPKQYITQHYYQSGCGANLNHTFTVGSASASVEDIDAARSQSGILRRIVYPTGGYADFDFENNMYSESGFTNAQPAVVAGGLRIRSINYYDGKSSKPTSQKYYRYGELEDGIGLIVNTPPRVFDHNTYVYDAFHFNQQTYYLGAPSSGAPCQNAACLTNVTYENKTTYWPTSALDYTYASGAPVYYTKVTEYNSDMGMYTGRKVYNFYKPDAFVSTTIYNNIFYGTNIPMIKSDGFMGMEKSEEDYKFENNQYTLIHKKEYDYTKYEQSPQPRVVYSFLKNTYVVTYGNYNGNATGLYDISLSGSFEGRSQDYQSGTYGIKVGRLLLVADREKWFNGADSSVSATDYYYDNGTYLQPSRLVSTGSDGHQVTQTIKYAYDFAGTAVYDQMVTNHMISPKVDVVTFDNTAGVEISHTRTNYSTFTPGPSFIAPASSQSSVKGNALENELTYDSYDGHANPTQVTGRDGLAKSYLWGYGYKYPVAELVGVTYPTVTSNINVTTFQSVTDDTQIRTAIGSLKTALPSAMITSFTYKPLIGISSQTAPNGINKYYEYDNVGRLTKIRDHNLNIISKTDYKMTGPTTIYPTTLQSTNVPIMGTMNRACGAPSNYQVWNFTEAGGKYNESTVPLANGDAETMAYVNEGPTSATNAPCTPASQLSTISLTAFMFTGNPIPSDVYADFMQNRSIVASQKFPYYSGTTQFYVTPGQYQLGLRMSANYNLSVVEYYVQPSSGTGFYVKPGATVTFAQGITYTVTVSNALIP